MLLLCTLYAAQENMANTGGVKEQGKPIRNGKKGREGKRERLEMGRSRHSTKSGHRLQKK